MENLAIRFHFGGTFFSSDGQLKYYGGNSAMSYVEIDKLSFPEIIGHLADHVERTDVMRLHYLRPGMELSNGLMLLVDDVSCLVMYDHITDGRVAEIYVENVAVESTREDVTYHRAIDEADQVQRTEHNTEDKDSGQDVEGQEDSGQNVEDQDSDTSDDDYHQPIDEDSSAEDDEAEQMRNFAKEVKRNIKAKKLGVHGSQLDKITPQALFDEGCNLEDEAEPYFDSSDDYSYEENSDGESERWKSLENRYDSKASVPVFCLGMSFRCSRQFKKAEGSTRRQHKAAGTPNRDEKIGVPAIWGQLLNTTITTLLM